MTVAPQRRIVRVKVLTTSGGLLIAFQLSILSLLPPTTVKFTKLYWWETFYLSQPLRFCC